MASHNLAHIQIDDLDVYGYSVAGEEAVIAIPQLDVCFDIGKAPEQFIPINNVLLTHGHMDHAAGFAYHLSHRKFCGQKPGTMLVPENLISPIKQILDAWGKLDGNTIPANIVPIKAGDEYNIKPNLIARAFPTKHSRGSVGYTVIETRKKLKKEYLELTSRQIVELKKQGVQIDDPVEMPIVTYLGDTSSGDFSKIDYIKNSKILITECTFYMDEHIERAKAGRHIHVNEFAEMIENLNNEHIIVCHITQRTSIGHAKKMLRDRLSKECFSKIKILMEFCD